MIKRLFINVMLTLILAMPISALSQDDDLPEGMTRYENDLITFTHPEAWVMDDTDAYFISIASSQAVLERVEDEDAAYEAGEFYGFVSLIPSGILQFVEDDLVRDSVTELIESAEQSPETVPIIPEDPEFEELENGKTVAYVYGEDRNGEFVSLYAYYDLTDDILVTISVVTVDDRDLLTEAVDTILAELELTGDYDALVEALNSTAE